MNSNEKERIRKEMFETRLKSTLYTMEHKEESKELLDELKALRREYAAQLRSELENKEKGEMNYVEHKRK